MTFLRYIFFGINIFFFEIFENPKRFEEIENVEAVWEWHSGMDACELLIAFRNQFFEKHEIP